MKRNENLFEFDGDNLDALWDEVKDLKPNECRQIRHATQGADGVISRIKEDVRFEEFSASTEQYKKQFQIDDPRLFNICRKMLRG